MLRRLQATVLDKPPQSALVERTEEKSSHVLDLRTALAIGPYAHANQYTFRRLQKLVSPGNPHKYMKQKEIGEGGSGKVYKGIERDSGKAVAIKVMRLVIDRNGAPYIPEFNHEIENMKNICSQSMNHENIVRYLDSYLVDNELWLVMDYLDGLELRQASAIDMDTKEVALIFYNILKATECIHNNQIVHTDLKSENILLSKRGDVKIADFGLTRTLSDDMVDGATTIYIMAPELAKGDV
jgi:serine/threonine protein kinase